MHSQHVDVVVVILDVKNFGHEVISGIFCVGYGVARTFCEFFREPDIQIGFLPGGLTMGMTLSIPMIAFGIGLLIWSVRRNPAPLAAGE